MYKKISIYLYICICLCTSFCINANVYSEWQKNAHYIKQQLNLHTSYLIFH